MFKIGDKVSFSGGKMVGYIVKIEIMSEFEEDVSFDKENSIYYTIRVFKDFYKDGYEDFRRIAVNLTKVE